MTLKDNYRGVWDYAERVGRIAYAIGAGSLYSPSCLVEVPSDVRRERLRKIARLGDALGRIRGHHTCGEKGYRDEVAP